MRLLLLLAWLPAAAALVHGARDAEEEVGFASWMAEDDFELELRLQEDDLAMALYRFEHLREEEHLKRVKAGVAKERLRPALQALAAVGSPHKRLQAARPLAWLHVPKCGSSFSNFLIDLPGMCPGVPHNVIINKSRFGEMHLGHFREQFDPLDMGCGPESFSKWGNHQGVGDDAHYEEMYVGHGVGFLRVPEQRIVSGLMHGFHDYKEATGNETPSSSMEYAETVAGCQVKMMAREGEDEVCGGPEPTPADLATAKYRLNRGFVFLGLTEHWELSICLAHKIFGGPCRGSDFQDSRLGKKRLEKDTGYDLSKFGLKGFTDPYDAELYAEGERFFAEALHLFGVTAKECTTCMREARKRPW